MFLSLFNRKKASFVECKSTRQDLELVGEWLSNGSLKVDIDSMYAVREMKNALKRQRDNSKVGHVVIQVEGGW